MSIKQGEYLKKLRTQSKLSQEQLAEKLNLSRQSISKWEQGTSTPDIENFAKLAKLYGVSVDSLVKGESDQENSMSSVRVINDQKEDKNSENRNKKRRGWFFISYPIIMIIAYAVIGILFQAKGWATGWLVFLTIPLFYTAILAYEKKKPIIFCYPVLMVIIYLICGIFFHLWHPMWIVFLTIPLFYIITAKRKK